MSPRRTRLRDELITLAHGAGGRATAALVGDLFLAELGNDILAPLGDAALLELDASRLALTTDAYVVKPLVFPGGDIGRLSVNGTVNDLAVSGARPVAISAGFVVEEGFPTAQLRDIARSMAQAASSVGCVVAAGDTKVVERGKADGVYVTTTGIGVVAPDVTLAPGRVRAGDRVLLSGTMGDHGIAVLIARGDLALEVGLQSDTAPVLELAHELLALGPSLRWMRDPTRGGVATTLNELAGAAGVAVRIEEDALPLRREVAGACEILGIDPLYVANEGKLVAIVAPEAADDALRALRSHELGVNAAVIGTVEAGPDGMVLMDTHLGGSRIVDMLVGDPLPRIC